MMLSQLEQQLKSGALAPVYLVHGPEGFFRGEAVRLLKEAAAKRKEAMDVAEVDASATPARDILDNLRTPSLFAPSRLVVVENAEALFGDALPALIDYAKKPAARTALVLVAEELKAKAAKKGGRRKKKKGEEVEEPADLSALVKRATAVECLVLTRRDLPGWILDRARSLGKRMEPAAANALIELAGGDLGQLDGRIQSLVTFARDRERITTDDVTNLVGGDHARTVWELIGAVTDRNCQAALRAAERLLRDGETTPTGIVGLLAKDIRRMHGVKRLAAQRMSQYDIANALHMQAWLVKKVLDALGGITESQLKERLRWCVQADYDLKTGRGGEEEWVVEKLIMKLCGV